VQRFKTGEPKQEPFWGRLSGQALLDVYRSCFWVILVLQARVSFFSGAKMGLRSEIPQQELCGIDKSEWIPEQALLTTPFRVILLQARISCFSSPSWHTPTPQPVLPVTPVIYILLTILNLLLSALYNENNILDADITLCVRESLSHYCAVIQFLTKKTGFFFL
jgi:hypothetical protein